MKDNTISKNLGKVVARLAFKVTQANENSACIFIVHQPQMPKSAKKLRKFLCSPTFHYARMREGIMLRHRCVVTYFRYFLLL